MPNKLVTKHIKSDPLLEQIKQIAQDNPELTVQLIRAWLDDDEKAKKPERPIKNKSIR